MTIFYILSKLKSVRFLYIKVNFNHSFLNLGKQFSEKLEKRIHYNKNNKGLPTVSILNVQHWALTVSINHHHVEGKPKRANGNQNRLLGIENPLSSRSTLRLLDV